MDYQPSQEFIKYNLYVIKKDKRSSLDSNISLSLNFTSLKKFFESFEGKENGFLIQPIKRFKSSK